MRRILLFLITIFSVSGMLDAQDSGWVRQRSNTTEWLHSIDFVSKSTGWAVGEEGTILKSTSEGFTWIAETSGTTEPLMSIDFIDSLHGWTVGGCSGCSSGGIILKTTDGGLHWVTKDIGHLLNAVHFTTLNNGWAVGCDGLILQTNDGGETWTQVLIADLFSCLETIYFADDSTGWIGGFIPGVVLKTTDAGANWISLTDSINPQEDVDGIFFLDRNAGWLVGYGFPDTIGIGIIKKTTDGGATWISQNGGVNDALLSVGFANANSGWTVSSGGTILRTTNGGTTWSPEASNSTGGLEKIVVREGEGAWVAGSNGTILRKNFGGLTPQTSFHINMGWNLVDVPLAGGDGLPSSLFPEADGPLFYYSPPGSYLIATTLQTGVGYWIRMRNEADVAQVGIPLDSLALTLDQGWNLVGGITDDIPVGNIKQDPPNSIESIFGYNSTYFPALTIEHGKGYWIRCNQSCTVTFYKIVPAGVPSVAMTEPNRFRNDQLPPPAPGDPVIARHGSALPGSYSLAQNYPNPFNPTTSIKFDLPEQSVVRLSVFNILGQEVVVLVDGVEEAGFRQVEWNPNSQSNYALPSGVYIYRIEATALSGGKEFVQTKKMVLMK